MNAMIIPGVAMVVQDVEPRPSVNARVVTENTRVVIGLVLG